MLMNSLLHNCPRYKIKAKIKLIKKERNPESERTVAPRYDEAVRQGHPTDRFGDISVRRTDLF